MVPGKGRKIDVETPKGATSAAAGQTPEPDEVLEPEVVEPEDEDAKTADDSKESPAPEEAAPTAAPAGAADKAKDDAKTTTTPVEMIAAAQAKAAEANDRYMRLQAEWDNFRKRSAAERASERERAAERIVTDLIPVVDDFERAIDHASGCDDEAVKTMVEGIQAVHAKLVAVLEKESVKVIDPLGQAFDANCHQAVGKVDDPSVPDETVAQVYQKGYEMGGHVIRPAMVTVSTGGPKRPKEDAKDDAGSGGAGK